MPNLNRVILIGHITKDIELKTTNSGKTVANFSIAVTEGTGEYKQTSFIEVTAWRKTAEVVAQYCGKGSCVMIDGKLKQDVWEQDGKKRSKLSVTALNIQFITTKKSEPVRQDDIIDDVKDMFNDDEIPF